MVKVKEIRHDPCGTDVWVLEGCAKDFRVLVQGVERAFTNPITEYAPMTIEVRMAPSCCTNRELGNQSDQADRKELPPTIVNHYDNCTFYTPSPIPTYRTFNPFKLVKEEK